MNQRTPFTIQGSLVLLGLRLATGVLILVITYALSDAGVEGDGVFFDIRDAVYRQFGLEGDDPRYLFGLLLGNLLVPGTSNIISLLAIRRKKYYLSITFLAIDFLFIMSKAIPMIPVIVLVLLFLPPSRRYFGLTSDRNME